MAKKPKKPAKKAPKRCNLCGGKKGWFHKCPKKRGGPRDNSHSFQSERTRQAVERARKNPPKNGPVPRQHGR